MYFLSSGVKGLRGKVEGTKETNMITKWRVQLCVSLITRSHAREKRTNIDHCEECFSYSTFFKSRRKWNSDKICPGLTCINDELKYGCLGLMHASSQWWYLFCSDDIYTIPPFVWKPLPLRWSTTLIVGREPEYRIHEYVLLYRSWRIAGISLNGNPC